MRALHLGCMPFPSPQGTQAAVHAMLTALADAGEAPTLLVYGHGAGPIEARYAIARLPALPLGRSLRSGPSLGKVALDALLMARLRAAMRAAGAARVVAHNVEAALVARAAGVPYLYFAHTAMQAELPFYGAPRLAGALGRAGRALDAAALAGALAVPAISPALAARLAAQGAPARYVPTPWAPSAPAPAGARREGRARLGLAPDSPVALYAGNLDRYQGVEDVLAAVAAARVRPALRLVVATASDPRPLWRAAAAAGVAARLCVLPLATEADRVLAHAIADLAIVPRRAPGGLPIKLLEALARGLPLVATARAAAGLPLGEAAVVVPSDDVPALAPGVAEALARGPALAAAGRAYLRSEHAPARFVEALGALGGGGGSELGTPRQI